MSLLQRLTDRKKLAIVDAAITEFRAAGFDATSMDRIAATAAVSKRTVYNHFPSKDALFAEIMRRLWERSGAQTTVPYRSDQTPREQLLELMRQKMLLLTETSFIDLARVAVAETIHSPQRARDMVARLGDKDVGLPAWIRAAQEDGKLKPVDPLFAAQLLEAPLKTIAFWPQVTMGQPALAPASQQQAIEAAVDMFLAHFGL
jgi:TetR/AcrR family transcriptional regulator of autoinduction and epiphytic fitness